MKMRVSAPIASLFLMEDAEPLVPQMFRFRSFIRVGALLLLSTFLLYTCAKVEIDGAKVSVDPNTKEYTYSEGGAKVTGTVVFSEVDKETGKTYRQFVIEAKDGKRIGVAHRYYPSGKLQLEYSFDSKGLESGIEKQYRENGSVLRTSEYKDDMPDGTAKLFDEKGTEVEEAVVHQDKLVVLYKFDAKGNKYVPDEFKLIGKWESSNGLSANVLILNDDNTFSFSTMLGNAKGKYVTNSDTKMLVLNYDDPSSSLFFPKTAIYSFVDDNDLILTGDSGSTAFQKQPSE